MTSVDANILTAQFDCVVMLTWSDWKTEPRSNRYHYALRFGKQLPVIFVQPDLVRAETKFDKTEAEGVFILHVYSKYGSIQNKLINRAILSKGFIKPLLWIYNSQFSGFVAQHFSPLSIYHATEDYFSPDFKSNDEFYKRLDQTLDQTDLLLAVSEEVLQSYVKRGGYKGETLLLPNGCDFKFWAPSEGEVDKIISLSYDKKIALYQGGLNWRLDWTLIDAIGQSLPDWEIWLCGNLNPKSKKDLKSLRSRNVKNLGYLDSERIRAISHKATVGIIPFKQIDMIQVSLPLKAFEYTACGLPVVSVPIKALEAHRDLFEFATTAQEFGEAILRAAPSRFDKSAINRRLKAAADQDYDIRFCELVKEIDHRLRNKKPELRPLNILILYDANSIHINTIREHLQGFSNFSRSHVFYTFATHNEKCTDDLASFDVIIVHYSIRLSLDWHLSQSFAEGLRDFGGYKILFIQDEYETTETSRMWIESLGIHAVFTCVPQEYVDLVYPPSRFPYLERVPTLTGYIPIGMRERKPKPMSERKNVIGYRGRPLPYYYGDLCLEKTTIAQRMKQICEERGIPADIEYTHEKRIYGDEWYTFVENCKATLGTESGSNVFDDYGTIKTNVEQALKMDPSLTYEEIHEKYIGAEEGRIKMNQVSPRIFEAIVFRTALVLFEGTYSGVVKPEKHYILLKKDFSNIEEVLAKLQDDEYLEALTERAFKDVIESGKYSYQKFITDFDEFLSARVVRRSKTVLLTGVIGAYDPDLKQLTIANYKIKDNSDFGSFYSTDILSPEHLASKDIYGKFYEIDLITVLRSIKALISKQLQMVPFLDRTAQYIYRKIKNFYNKLRIRLKG